LARGPRLTALGPGRRDERWLTSLPRVESRQDTPERGQPPLRDGLGVTLAAYAALFLLGIVQGLIGTFQYSRGPAPLAAILFDLGILATCVLASWGMRTALGGVLPAAGWLLVTLVLSSAPAGGSVIVTATQAGEWFLFGGSLAAVAGAIIAFARWGRPRHRSAGQGRGPR
jgi:Family of unknown function (DUF6113)